MVYITATTLPQAYSTELKSATNTLITDEPLDHGGKDQGFSPFELLAASLGACTCITLRMYAERKEWQLTEVKADVTLERDSEKNITNISRKITLLGNLDQEQTTRLLHIANQCPVHKILSNAIHIETELR